MHTTRTAILLCLIGLVSCFARQAEEAPHATPAPEVVQELTPPSELALLMRSMAAHADTVKAALGRGEDLPPYPKAFSNLMKAEPTKGMHIDPITFPTFAKDYLDKVDRLYKAKKTDRTRAYNALVQSCANCHGSHCPGPLMRIKKMYVTGSE
ncbi:MAG: hypothetical protein JNL43_15910 [Flavobacteriales bacterium]|nr:hypothetical protein [Flavobacteriales bacterium]